MEEDNLETELQDMQDREGSKDDAEMANEEREARAKASLDLGTIKRFLNFEDFEKAVTAHAETSGGCSGAWVILLDLGPTSLKTLVANIKKVARMVPNGVTDYRVAVITGNSVVRLGTSMYELADTPRQAR